MTRRRYHRYYQWTARGFFAGILSTFCVAVFVVGLIDAAIRAL